MWDTLYIVVNSNFLVGISLLTIVAMSSLAANRIQRGNCDRKNHDSSPGMKSLDSSRAAASRQGIICKVTTVPLGTRSSVIKCGININEMIEIQGFHPSGAVLC
jgi:hypothetical protein